jgi:hypothetical protein
LSEEAIVRCCLLADPSASEDAVRGEQFLRFADHIGQNMQALYLLYSIAYSLRSELQTVSHGYAQLCHQRDRYRKLDKALVRLRLTSFARLLVQEMGWEVYKAASSEVKLRTKKRNVPARHLVSGKSVILPMILGRVAATYRYRGTFEQFKAQLAEGYDPGAEPYLARALKRALGRLN